MECDGSDILPNYYAVLNIYYHASTQEIARAFYYLVNDPKTNAAHFNVITDAYDCLSNPVDRDAYSAFYFHAPCWYSKPLWVAYRNERRRLQELQLRQKREILGQLTVTQIEALQTIAIATMDASGRPCNDEIEAQNRCAANTEVPQVNDGVNVMPAKKKGRARRRGQGGKPRSSTKNKTKDEINKSKRDSTGAKDAVKKLADSRWADPHTCVNGLACHPQEGWQMKVGRARCAMCDHRQCESTYRCGKCDATFCKDCHFETNNAQRGRAKSNA